MHMLYILKNFLLFFNFFALAVCDYNCPSECDCTKQKSFHCSNKGLENIPKVFDEAKTIDLRFNFIKDIAPGTFAHNKKAAQLLLNNNQIQQLRAGAFHGLHHLRYLYIYRNRIEHIDTDVFHGMTHLQQLYLHSNRIKQIQPDTFHDLPQLQRLYLHHNFITSIPRGSFSGMSKLEKLRLDVNPLVCDCSMFWFIQTLIHTTEVTGICEIPNSDRRATLYSISEDEFKCRHPEIQKGPQDIVVDYGSDATFSCVATGEPQPEIVWFRDSEELPLNTTRYEVMDNGTLMIHKADEMVLGKFECMAKNPTGAIRSRSARMILNEQDVQEAPVFKVVPQKQVARINQSFVIFDCLTEGRPQPQVSWHFNKKRIRLDVRYSVRANGSLAIHNIENSDMGSYTCHAKNIYGEIEATADLQVLVAPAVLVVPTNQTVSVGQQAKFECKASGLLHPQISWFKNISSYNSTQILPENENYILSNDNQVFTIFEATTDDKGIYLCRVVNSENQVESFAILNVIEAPLIAPKILSKTEDIHAYEGTSIQIFCEVVSNPPANIEWRKDGSRISPNETVIVTLIGSLMINNVSVTHTGRYECSAFNEYGRDTTSVFVTIHDHSLPGDQFVNIALTQAIKDIEQSITNTLMQMFSNTCKKIDIQKLFAISRYPNAQAREIARAAEIYERTLDKVKELVQVGFKVTLSEPFDYYAVLSSEHLEIIAKLSGCVAHRDEKNCSDMSYHSKYRNYDGTCNNFAHTMWGASLTGFRRILFPVYENGFSQPVGWNKSSIYNGFSLPSARLISITIISTDSISEDLEISHMTMQWGQWLDHDLDHALPSVSSETWDGTDCKKSCKYAPPCFPIDVPLNDPRIKNRRCIDFFRTSAVCGSGTTSALFGKLQHREQINQLTSYLDASQVYGFENSVAEDLRDLTNDNGLLRTGVSFPGKKPFLPTTGLNSMDCRRNLEESDRNCFVAGDIRANEQIGLTAMHTIWMREHNRIASTLKYLNPLWDGEKIYQEARKIVGAEMQFITYEDWLPLIIGNEGYRSLGQYKGYNASINPSISNVFATAALRFGHSMINPVLHRYDENLETIPQGHLELHQAFFAPWRLVDEGGVDPLIRGMFATPAKLKTPTQNLNSELTEKLFHSAHAVALDLAAINIQRGRDHGLPPYTKWREFCNMTKANNFDDLQNEITDKNVRDQLEDLYGSVHNIDVWVGGILEDQVQGGKVGPLFRCLLIEQFQRLRDGDRFWYENPSMFKPEQLEQIKQTSLTRVICDNSDNIKYISENVFLIPDIQNVFVECDEIPSMDLSFWADCVSCENKNSEHLGRLAIKDVNFENERHQDLGDKLLNKLENTQNNIMQAIGSLTERMETLEKSCSSE